MGVLTIRTFVAVTGGARLKGKPWQDIYCTASMPLKRFSYKTRQFTIAISIAVAITLGSVAHCKRSIAIAHEAFQKAPLVQASRYITFHNKAKSSPNCKILTEIEK
jgi:hypothetical protein